MTDVEAEELRQRAAALEAENTRLRNALAGRGAGQDPEPPAVPASTLAASRARLRNALTIATVGCIYFDMDGRILDANDAFLTMCGYCRADLQAGTLSWQALTPPEWLDVSWRAFNELMTKGHTAPYEKQGRLALLGAVRRHPAGGRTGLRVRHRHHGQEAGRGGARRT